MKKPRITDFDPDAKVPPLKSSFEEMPAIEKPRPAIKSLAHPAGGSSDRSQNDSLSLQGVANPSPTLPQASKRSFIKRTFDVYEDQLAYLTRESLQGRLAGKEVSMNAMVREAIDDWIKRRTTKE